MSRARCPDVVEMAALGQTGSGKTIRARPAENQALA